MVQLSVRLANFSAQRRVTCESVQQLEMRFGIEERLLISLSVNVHEKRAQIAQQRVCGELVVDEDLIATRRRNFATNDQLGGRSKTGVFEYDVRARDLA